MSVRVLAVAIFCLGIAASYRAAIDTDESIRGAWQVNEVGNTIVMIIEDDYCSITSFDKTAKKFNYSRGGAIKSMNGSTELTIEFNSADGKEVGKTIRGKYKLNGDRLVSDVDGTQRSWVRVDKSETSLTGCWRINRRINDGQASEMPLRPRKTLKILSGTRFQWMAINTSTGEFFGTGGGTYSFENGKYTEHIEFFSRDSARVGASLTFEGSVNNNNWRHKGKSSTGNPVNENWVRIHFE